MIETMDSELAELLKRCQARKMNDAERLEQAYVNATANALISFREAYRANLHD